MAPQMNVTKMLRIVFCEMISECEDQMISFYHGNEIAMTEFYERGINECRRRLRHLGLAHLIVDGNGDLVDQMHRTRSIVFNAPKMLEDLKDEAPEHVNRDKLELWRIKFKEEQAKAKRALDTSAPTHLPKCVKVAQDSVASGQPSSEAGTQHIMRTLHNHLCAHLVVIPNAAIKYIKNIGSGSFGNCSQVMIEGISFFPSTITYCAKTYKGGSSAKLSQFTTEKNMQKLNPGLVRCIACTGQPPWTSIFPYFNGGTIHSMLVWQPFRFSAYRRMAERLARPFGGSSRPQPDFVPQEHELGRIKGFIDNMPHIFHAIVNGMSDAHRSSFVHCDLHTKNICLDFTNKNACRVGIIDWGLMLLEGQTRPSHTYSILREDDNAETKKIHREEGERQRRLRPWMAPELYDPYVASAYSKASDVFALGYLFIVMIDFWKQAQTHFLGTKFEEHPDHRRMYLLQDIVERRMYNDVIDQRITLLELEDWLQRNLVTEPKKAQRPLVEMSPNFL